MVKLIVADGDWCERFDVESTEDIETKYKELSEKYEYIELRKDDHGNFFISCGDTRWWEEPLDDDEAE